MTSTFWPRAMGFIYPYGIFVNKRGERFIDEAPGTVDAHYDNITRSIAYQPDGQSYVIFDAKVEDIPRWKTSIRSDIPPYEADSIEQLAELIGISPESLGQTVAEFNAACPPDGAGTFDPFVLDFRATKGLAVRKSHWSRPIDKGPFRAYPVVATNCFTFGGVKVNADAQVLDQDGRVLNGLYAAGETMGIYHNVYTGSTSVLRGLVFGRRAAAHAAAELRSR
jgi:tricarballylate dehydrogenase